MTETQSQSKPTAQWDNSRIMVCDRHLAYRCSQGYCLSAVDKTSFTSDTPVLLGQFDCAKLFIYQPGQETAVDSVPVKIQIVEKKVHVPERPATIDGYTVLYSYSEQHTTVTLSEMVIFEQQTNLQSHSEAHISISPPIVIRPEFMYEIQIHTPPDELYLYNEFYSVCDFSLNDGGGEAITIKIQTCGRNELVHSRSIRDSRRCISAGAVKRLHFNRLCCSSYN